MIKIIRFNETETIVEVFNANEHLQKHWVQGAFYEAHKNGLLNWAYTKIPHNGIYIDVGASIGNHTLFMANVMKAEAVYAFEPVGKHYKWLRRNLAHNRLTNVHTFNFALSDEEGKGYICYAPHLRHQTGGMMSGEFHRERPAHVSTEAAQAITLNSLPYQLPEEITWMKLDCEGSEPAVLRGASEILGEKRIEFISAECRTLPEFDEVSKILDFYEYELIQSGLNHTPTYVWKR